METGKKRLLMVYQALGRVLTNPQEYGLADRPPDRLVVAITAMRHSLREELAETDLLIESDWLSGELAQDADRLARRSSKT